MHFFSDLKTDMGDAWLDHVLGPCCMVTVEIIILALKSGNPSEKERIKTEELEREYEEGKTKFKKDKALRKKTREIRRRLRKIQRQRPEDRVECRNCGIERMEEDMAELREEYKNRNRG